MNTSKETATLRMGSSYDIPSVPLVLTRILQILSEDTSSAKKLEDLIRHDPALSARILRLANSAFYSFRYDVKTISHAIALLGLKVVKSLAIGVSIFQSFTQGMKKEATLINGLWVHSFGTALLSQEIWTRCGDQKEAEFAFLCGLLHDLGKVLFFKNNPARYAEMYVAKKGEHGPDISALELESFDIDHATAGAILAKQWALPPDLALVIRLHHAPLTSEKPLVAAVSLADILAKTYEIGYDGDRIIPPDLDKILAPLNLDPEGFEQIRASAETKRRDAVDFFQF